MVEEGKTGLLDLEKELSCSICTEILYQPLTLLDCLHTFCGSCLKEWFTWQATQSGGRRSNPYTCPSCRNTVRGTRPDAKITTLLDMYLQANPSKAKSEEEKRDLKRKYTPGENVIPKPNSRSSERVSDETRATGQRETGPRGIGSYERGTNHSTSGRDRRQETSPTIGGAHGRHVEHQSSLRSMISSSDADSSEMVDEILRQITEDGLLDGIDLNDMTLTQLDELSERIANAYRQRHGPGPRSSDTRRTHNRHNQDASSPRRSPRGTVQQNSRSTSGTAYLLPSSTNPPISRPHLLATSPTTSSTRRRTSSETRDDHHGRAIQDPRSSVREQATRSATDLSDRPQSSRNRERRPSDHATQRRRSTEPRPETSTTRSEHARGSSMQGTRPRQSPSSSPRAEFHSGLIPVSSVTDTVRDGPSRDSSVTEIGTPASNVSNSPKTGQVTATSSTPARPRATLYPEPSIECDSCQRKNIQYELHEFCAICKDGHYSLCHRCYRSGKGCLHWFGFGKAAWPRFRQKLPSSSDLPHTFTGRRWRHPRTEIVQSVQAGTDHDRRILTTEDPATRLQTGAFCSGCAAYADDCYWKCDECNEGEWGYCNSCVNQGRCCTHALLPLAYVNSPDRESPSASGIHAHSASVFAPITSPVMIQSVPASSLANARQYRPLAFNVNCDVCHYPIPRNQSRYHCFLCNEGDYDICMACYSRLIETGRISSENGEKGWRRCIRGHRMIVVAFEETALGQHRLILHDLVGGVFLKDDANTNNSDVQEFSWLEGGERKTKTVKRDLSPRPSGGGSAAPPHTLPPDGGVGHRLLALWPWIPAEGVTDELAFPRGAEIREALEISSDWYMGAYAGSKGVFPSNHVEYLGAVTM